MRSEDLAIRQRLVTGPRAGLTHVPAPLTTERFVAESNRVLRELVYPLFHEQARFFMHHGVAVLLRHYYDPHLVPIETDPVGLKLYTAPASVGRKGLAEALVSRDFLHPDYLCVQLETESQRLVTGCHLGGIHGSLSTLRGYTLEEVSASLLRADLEHYATRLPYLQWH